MNLYQLCLGHWKLLLKLHRTANFTQAHFPQVFAYSAHRLRFLTTGALTVQASEAQPAADREPSGNVGLDDAEGGGDIGDGEDDFERQMRASAMAKRKAFGKPEAPRPQVGPVDIYTFTRQRPLIATHNMILHVHATL